MMVVCHDTEGQFIEQQINVNVFGVPFLYKLFFVEQGIIDKKFAALFFRNTDTKLNLYLKHEKRQHTLGC